MPITRNDRGFSAIEVLIAATIIVVALLAIASKQVTVTVTSATGRGVMLVSLIAQ